jgi:hypothetical protein
MTTATDVAAARANAADAEQRLRTTIVRALDSGVPASLIAEAAGLTRQRIYQIRDANRAPAP